MNDWVAVLLAVIITVPFPVISFILARRHIKEAHTTEYYLSVLSDRSATAEQHANAFCSLINIEYVHAMTKTNNGGKYKDLKHVQRFMKSVNTQRVDRINSVVERINYERVNSYEHN